MRLGDRIAVMKGGRIVQAGKTEALYRDPASLFVARLFSEINELPARISGGAIATPAGRVDAGGAADGPAVIGIRERAIAVTSVNNGAATGLNGRVLGRRFLGDMTRLDVGVEGFDKPLKVRLAQGSDLDRGMDVRVVIDPATILVFGPENIAES